MNYELVKTFIIREETEAWAVENFLELLIVKHKLRKRCVLVHVGAIESAFGVVL